MRRTVKTIAITAGAAFALALGTAPAAAGSLDSLLPPPLAPVPQLVTADYLGQWHQLAAVPQPFNLSCARDTIANYGLVDAENLSVENTCTTYSGAVSGIRGNARVNDAVTGAALHVSFPGVPFQDGQAGPTNYVVTYIADDYSWALVGDPARLSGFVLSRTPAVTPEQWREIRAVVEARGYNSCLFLTTPATGGWETVQPLCTV